MRHLPPFCTHSNQRIKLRLYGIVNVIVLLLINRIFRPVYCTHTKQYISNDQKSKPQHGLLFNEPVEEIIQYIQEYNINDQYPKAKRPLQWIYLLKPLLS
jgi:hypothetical protein